VRRIRFNQLVAEISRLLGRALPRYGLWLRLHELGYDPETLSRRECLRFCERELESFLGERGLALPARAQRRLLRTFGGDVPPPPSPQL
jgi:hypothetical protein